MASAFDIAVAKGVVAVATSGSQVHVLTGKTLARKVEPCKAAPLTDR